jgi:hypothetical protein
MKKYSVALLFAFALLFVPSSHAQYVNSQNLGQANFNSTTPAADPGFNLCTFKTQGTLVVVECPTGQSSINSIAYSTTPVLALSLGSVQQFACTTAGASIVPTVTGLKAGKTITVIFVQNGTTACTWTWPSTFHGTTAVSATLSSVSVQEFVVSANGTDAYAKASGSAGQTGGTP